MSNGNGWILHNANTPAEGDTQQVCTECGYVLMTDYPNRMGWLQPGVCSYNETGPTLTTGVQFQAQPCTATVDTPPMKIASAFAPTGVGEVPPEQKIAFPTTFRKLPS